MAQPNPTEDPASRKRPEWFLEELKGMDDKAREVFEKYSKIPSDEVIPHIKQMRDKAFDVFPYPCIGHFRFLDLGVSESPQYDEVLERVKNGDTYLDVGCCFGQDIRKLVFDGAPSENTYGSDLRLDFMELGYDLFRDRDTLKAKFIPGDVFDYEAPLKELDGKVDIIHAASFFHLFDYDEQVRVAKRFTVLLKAKPGSLIIGRHIGNVTASEFPRRSEPNKTRYRHNPESFEKMWKSIEEETGTKWDVKASLGDRDLSTYTDLKFDFLPPGTKVMTYTVRRL